MSWNKFFCIIVFGLLLVTSFSIHSVGLVTLTDNTIVDDTLGIVLSFDNDWIDIGNASFDYVDYKEIAAPASPSVNVMRLYVEDYHGFSITKSVDSTGMVRSLIRDSVFVCKNVRGTSIPSFRCVYATGSVDDVPTIDLAKADSMDTMPCIGVTLEAIADGSFGRVMQIGILENVNTLAYSSGDILYVSADTAGVVTSTVPVVPNLIQEIGTVLADSATVGSVQIVARALDGNEFGTVNDFTIQGNLTVVGIVENNLNIKNTTANVIWNIYVDSNGVLIWEIE